MEEIIMKRFTLISITLIVVYVLWLPTFSFSQEAVSDSSLQIKTMTTNELVNAAKKYAPQITVEQAKQEIEAGSVVILDVREPKEFKQGHLPGAINIPRGLLEFKVLDKIPDQNSNIVVYCKVGGRGALAAKTLRILGYNNVKNIAGGWEAWLKAGFDVE
jgi:rhodanese-related sulfurtransferase